VSSITVALLTVASLVYAAGLLQKSRGKLGEAIWFMWKIDITP